MDTVNQALIQLRNLGVNSNIFGWESLLANLPPSDYALSKLGTKGFVILREVYNDPFVFGAIQSRKSGTLLSDWNIRGDASRLRWFFKLPISKLINEVLDAIFFGFQVFEINWSMDYIPEEVIRRDPMYFRLKDGQLILEGKNIEIPKQKFIAVKFGESLYEIYGTSVLSKIYYYWLFLKGATKMWVRYVEKFGIPFIEIKAPGDVEQYQLIVDQILNSASNGIVAHTPNIDLNFIDLQARDGVVFVSLIEHCKNAINQAILGHDRATQATPGRLGNETLATQVRADLIEQDKRFVENFFDTLISYFWELHYDDEQAYFYFVPVEDLQIERAKRDQILAQIGVPFSPDYWKRVYNLGDEDVKFESSIPKQVKIADTIIDEAIKKDYLNLNEKIEKVEEKLKSVDNYEEAFKELLEMFSDVTDEELLQKMNRLFYWAYFNGFLNR